MVGVSMLGAENSPSTHLKRAITGTEGIHATSRMGDGNNSQKNPISKNCSCIGARGEKVSSLGSGE